jgi:hypothetical protein
MRLTLQPPADLAPMTFYVFTSANGVHFQHEDDPLSVRVLDDGMKPLGAIFNPATDEFDCAASREGGVFALCYWNHDLQVFDLHRGEQRAAFPLRKVTTPHFDETGRRLLLKSGSQVLLLDLKSGKTVHLKGLLAIERPIAIQGRNEVVIPSRKVGELLRLSLAKGTISTVPLPINATLFDMQSSPTNATLVLIDQKGSVHCVDLESWKIIWSVSLRKLLGKDHMGVGQFSGNGKWFGATVSGRNQNYTLVLDTRTGEIARRLETTCEGLPGRGNRVREASTELDSFVAQALDLSNGNESQVRIATSSRRQ